MEVSSLSWSTQTQQCYSCISSCYSTFFNNTLLQFPSEDGPWVACSPGQCCSLAFSISFHNRQELFPSPPGCLSLSNIISGCHTRTATELQALWVSTASQWGGWPWKGRSSLPSQLNSCSDRDNLRSPRAALTPEAPKAARHNRLGKEKKSRIPKATLKMSPMD